MAKKQNTEEIVRAAGTGAPSGSAGQGGSADSLLFQFKGRPPLGKVLPLGLQHVVSAIVGVMTPAVIVANACGLQGQDVTFLIQVSLVASALATLLQLFPLGRFGSGLPVIIGTSFAYIPTLTAIGNEFNIATIFGAQICGGVAAIAVGFFIKQIRPLFPPMVTGTVIFTIGLSLYPTAIRYMAGGGNAGTNPAFGSSMNWMVAIITLLVVIGLNHYAKGIAKLASILIAMAVGYLIALPLGMVSFSPIGEAGWFQVPLPMHFGVEFVPSAIITMVIMFIVNAVQAIGDFSSTTMGGMDREPTDRELSGGIMATNTASGIFALFGGLPLATYSQNVGIVTVTRVVNRTVFALAAGVMLLAGFIPKLSAVLSTIPQCVIGGATISVFASITMTGIRMIAAAGLNARNIAIIGLSVALGVGLTSVPGCLGGFPQWVTTVFASSSVVIATVTAVAANLILPKDNPGGSAASGKTSTGGGTAAADET